MFLATILYSLALLIIAGALFLGFLYGFEAKIKVNNNSNYKNDQDLKNAHKELNLASYICLFSLILLIIAVCIVFFFSEIIFPIIKWIILIAAVILFLVLIYVEYLFFSAINNMKNSTSFTDTGDDQTALRDARIGAWSIFICMFAIVAFIIFVIFLKIGKKYKEKKAKESKEEEVEEEEDEE